MDPLYSHEDSFDEYGESTGIPVISLSLPAGETLVVSGPRQTPMVITISNKAERNPRRDARMLATYLSTSLDEQTVYFLSEMLFTEYLSPVLKETQKFLSEQVSRGPEIKKVPKNPKNPPKSDDN